MDKCQCALAASRHYSYVYWWGNGEVQIAHVGYLLLNVLVERTVIKHQRLFLPMTLT